MYDDLPQRLVVVALSCAFFLYFIFRAPAANTFFMLALLGTSSTPIYGNLRFGMMAVILQLIAICLLAVQAAYRGGLRYLAAFLSRKESIFLYVLALVWLKAILDGFISGFDDVRIDTLRVGVNMVLCPSALCLLGSLAYSKDRLLGDLIKGCCAFSLVNAMPVLALRFAQGAVTAAITGGERLHGYSQTPLGYGVTFLYGFVGCLALFAAPKTRVWMKWLLVGVGVFLIAGILLTGTRQYVVGAAVASLGGLFFSLRHKKSMAALIVMPIALLLVFFNSIFFGAAIAERGRLDVMEEDSRFEIWKGSYDQMMEHPFTGIGFRKSGKFEEIHDPDTGEITESQDDAHGFFQNIFVDFGVPLGLLSLLSFIAVLVWTQSNREIPVLHGMFVFCLLGPCGAAFFTGNIQDSPAFYIIGILATAISISPQRNHPPGSRAQFEPNEHQSALAGHALDQNRKLQVNRSAIAPRAGD